MCHLLCSAAVLDIFVVKGSLNPGNNIICGQGVCKAVILFLLPLLFFFVVHVVSFVTLLCCSMYMEYKTTLAEACKGGIRSSFPFLLVFASNTNLLCFVLFFKLVFKFLIIRNLIISSCYTSPFDGCCYVL